MGHITKAASVAVIALMATGCANTSFQETLGSASESVSGLFNGYEAGTHVDQKTMAQIEPGMSKAGVKELLGPAPEVDHDGPGETWKYPYEKIPHFGQNVSEVTVISFDDQGNVVEAHQADTAGSNPLIEAGREQGSL